jgi:hypothetical protein
MSRTEQKISSLGEVEDRSRCKEIGSSFKENRQVGFTFLCYQAPKNGPFLIA